MMEILKINHATGYVDIIPDYFFPTTVDKLKQLIKVIRLDWNNQDDIRDYLKQYFQEKLKDKRLNKTQTATWERHLRLIQKEIDKYKPPPEKY